MEPRTTYRGNDHDAAPAHASQLGQESHGLGRLEVVDDTGFGPHDDPEVRALVQRIHDATGVSTTNSWKNAPLVAMRCAAVDACRGSAASGRPTR